MIVSVPSCARGEEPVTGASSRPIPSSASRSPIDTVAARPMVEQSTHRVPGEAALAAPRSPSSTSSTWGASTSMVTTSSADAAASAGV